MSILSSHGYCVKTQFKQRLTVSTGSVDTHYNTNANSLHISWISRVLRCKTRATWAKKINTFPCTVVTLSFRVLNNQKNKLAYFLSSFFNVEYFNVIRTWKVLYLSRMKTTSPIRSWTIFIENNSARLTLAEILTWLKTLWSLYISFFHKHLWRKWRYEGYNWSETDYHSVFENPCFARYFKKAINSFFKLISQFHSLQSIF